MNDSIKTANQLYKESGSEEPFSVWLAKEKDKGTLMKNQSLAAIIETEKEKLTNQIKVDQTKKVFGLNKNVLIFSGVLISLALIYKLSQKK